jgi:hypothetical protein
MIRHIREKREAEKRAPHSPQPHLNLNDESIGYKPRISQRELKRLSVDERDKRRKDVRNQHQRRRRELSKEKAKEQAAAAYGDVTHWRLFDKTAEYSRMAATKRRLEENYKFLPTDPLLASDEMGGLFCFYLHFSLSVAVPEDLDEQPNGVAALIGRLRAAYPGEDGETFRTVGPVYFVCHYHSADFQLRPTGRFSSLLSMCPTVTTNAQMYWLALQSLTVSVCLETGRAFCAIQPFGRVTCEIYGSAQSSN